VFAANGGAITVACGGASTHVLHYDNNLSGNCNISGDVTSTLSTIPSACGGDVTESWDVTTACDYVLHSQRTITISPAASPVFAANGGAITVACGGASTHVLHYDNSLSGGCNISGDVTSTLSTIPSACGGDVT